MCPHNFVKEQLEHHLNTHRNLALLGKILHETYGTVKALSKLPTVPITLQKINPPVQTFSIVPQSPTHLKVFFYNTFCLDIYIKSDNHILVRDAAISQFDQRKAMEDIQPIPFVKNFLLKYVDEAAVLHRRQSQVAEDDNPPSPMTVQDQQQTGSDQQNPGSQATGSSGLKFQTPHTPPSNPLTPASPHGFLQSPPAMRQPSPAGAPYPSPGNPQAPSPGGFTVPSPSMGGSPFPSAQSPASVNSPAGNKNNKAGKSGGTAVSRVLPQRLWAGSTPTPLTSKALADMCTPIKAANNDQSMMPLSPLHRFLGCMYLRKFVITHARSEEAIGLMQSPEPSTILFRVEGLKCKVVSYPSNQHQSLHLKLEPEPAFAHHWMPDMIQLLERFFDTRVAIPPFKVNAVSAFCKILQCPTEPLKDILNLLRSADIHNFFVE